MKVRVPRATARRQKFSGSPSVVSTHQMMEYCPLYYFNVIPNTDLEINLKGFGRTIPLPVPTFGRFAVHYNAFFVPYSSVFPGFNDFISDTLHITADAKSLVLNSGPYFTEESFINLLLNYGVENDGSVPFDIEFVGSQGDRFLALSPEGRRIYKIFCALGYRLSGQYAAGYEYGAIHLLAALRIYLDYFYPTQFRNNQDYIVGMSILNRDYTVSNTFVSELTTNDLACIFKVMNHVCYQDDYFTSSFTRINTPNVPFNTIQLQDPSSGTNSGEARTIRAAQSGSAIVNNTGVNQTPLASSGVTGSGSSAHYQLNSISQFLIDGLQRMTAYYKRNQLAGSMAYERLMARFGIKIFNNCSKFIGQYVLPLNVGDVMSTTDNFDAVNDTGANLGSYAGKGLLYNVRGDGKFNVHANEYGVVMIIASIVPQGGYYQGIDRHCLKYNFGDFFVPEYDALGMQAIRKDELYLFSDPALNDLVSAEGVFGFTPRYSEYKCFRDNVFGDFLCGTQNTGLDSYLGFRKFDDKYFSNSYAGVTQDFNFVQGTDYEFYNRIFGFLPGADMNDPVRLDTHFDITMYADMRSQYDDVLLDQLEHNSSGKSDFELSGAKVN